MRAPIYAVFVIVASASACGRDRPDPMGDGGSRDGSVAMVDAPASDALVPPADGGPMCTPEILVPFDGRPCPQAIADCVDACTDSDCLGVCLEMGTGDCAFCLDLNIVACVNRNGCQEPWNCYRDCVRGECGPTPTPACVEERCIDLENAFNACITDEILETCGTRYLDCLPE